MNKLFIGIAAFGDTYRNLLTNYLFPSLNAPGNLPALFSVGRKVTVIVTTTQEDRFIIEGSASCRELLRWAYLSFCIVRSPSSRTMTESHTAALEAAMQVGGTAMFLNADTVVPDGGLGIALQQHDLGVAAVNVAAFRTIRERILPELDQFFSEDGAVLSIGSRELTRLSIQYMHPVSAWHLWNDQAFSSYPSHMLWSCGENTFVLRGFHLHLLLCRPINPHARIEDTFDAKFQAQAVPDPSRIGAILDTDQFFLCETTKGDYLVELTPEASEIPLVLNEKERVLRTAHWCFNNYDHQIWRRSGFPMVIHSGQPTAGVVQVIEQSGFVLDTIREVTEKFRQLQALFDGRTVEQAAYELMGKLDKPFWIYGTSTYAGRFLDVVEPGVKGRILGFVDRVADRQWNGFPVVSPERCIKDGNMRILPFHPIYYLEMIGSLYLKGVPIESVLPSASAQ